MQAPEKFWEMLLTKIDEGRVIPVIGPELIRVDTGGRTEMLETLIARRLADQFDIDPEGHDGAITLHDVVARAHRQDPHEDYHSEVHRILKSLGDLILPETLQALARITNFKLYVTLAFDSLLSRALDEERGLTDRNRQHIGFAPNLRQIDLPAPFKQLDDPYVYSIFGKACSAPEFVISDEDQLEWIAALQDSDNRPKHLFDALRTDHLLFLGCALPDWLLRFFLRMTREGRFSASRPSETLIDSAIPDQPRLVAFLDHFSPKTIFIDTDPIDFVRQLEQRWQQRKQETNPTSSFDLPPDLRPGGVFLSYASDNIEPVTQLYGALTGRQIDTWFDARRLATGARYDKVIERNIGLCGVFIVVFSDATQERLHRWHEEGCHPDKKPYFLKEWELALAREKLFAGSLAICPIRIDEHDLADPMIPDPLRKFTCEYLPAGNADEMFLDRIKKSVREQRKRAGGRQ